MKIKIFTLLATLLTLPSMALAQVHGTVFGQGMNGQLSMGVRNDSGATINPLNLGWGTFAVTASGQIKTLTTDTAGNAQSVIPLSNSATGPNGTASLVVGTGLVTLDVIEAASTSQVLNLTAHVAVRGDVIRFPALASSPPTVRSWGVVCSTTTNTVTLCDPLGFTPVAAQDVSISRDIPIGAVGDSSTGSTSLNVNVTAPQGSAANGLLKPEDSAAASGDAGVGMLIKRTDSLATQTDTDGDYTLPVGTSQGVLATTVVASGLGFNNAQSLLRAEDGLHVSGDAGVSMFGVRNDGLASSLTSTNGDYGNIAITDVGSVWATLGMVNSSASAVRPEDAASGSGEALVVGGMKLQSALSVDAGANDYGTFKGDLDGRLITAPAPAGEMWFSCSGTITTTARTSIKAAVASNFAYVSHISCKNTSVVATGADFTAGAGSQFATGMIKAGDTLVIPFPIPARIASNTDVSVTLNTTATSTVCCANGYISVN